MDPEERALQEIRQRIDDRLVSDREGLTKLKREMAVKYGLRRIIPNSVIISYLG